MNQTLGFFLIAQAICLVLFYLYPEVLAKKDAIQIEANGRLDTLKKEWHRLNVIIRLMNVLPLGLLSVLPLLMEGIYVNALAVYVSLACFQNAWHWYQFDKRLNQLRGLDGFYLGKNAKSDLFMIKYPRAKPVALIVSGLAYICSVISLFFV